MKRDIKYKTINETNDLLNFTKQLEYGSFRVYDQDNNIQSNLY